MGFEIENMDVVQAGKETVYSYRTADAGSVVLTDYYFKNRWLRVGDIILAQVDTGGTPILVALHVLTMDTDENSTTFGATVRALGQINIATAWENLRVPVLAAKVGSVKPPTLKQFKDDGASSVGICALAFSYQTVAGNEEQIYFAAQFPHSYKEGSDIGVHVHFAVDPAGTPGAGEFCKWGLEYSWANVSVEFPDSTIVSGACATAAGATLDGDATLVAGKHYIQELGAIDGTGKGLSSMLLGRLFRHSSHAEDTLNEDCFPHEIDFHFEKDSPGSRQEYIK